MQGRGDEDEAPDAVPAPVPEPATGEPRVDTAVTTVIRGESVSILTPAWGTALVLDDAEVVVAELVEDEPSDGSRHAAPATGSSPIPEPATPRAPRPPVLGAVAVLGAIATIVLHALAVNAAAARDPEEATVLAWVAIGLSLGSILVGILAAILRSGRIVGAIAAVVALFANPWVLLKVLEFFAP